MAEKSAYGALMAAAEYGDFEILKVHHRSDEDVVEVAVRHKITGVRGGFSIDGLELYQKSKDPFEVAQLIRRKLNGFEKA